MLDATVHARRRSALMRQVDAPVLLVGNGERARNLPSTPVPFRQDSTFLYFTGCELPDAAALLVGDQCQLFLPAPHEDDPLWHGPEPGFDELRVHLGMSEVRDASELPTALEGLTPKVLAVADEARNELIGGLLGRSLRFGVDHGDLDLVDAVIALRRVKEPEEIELLRQAGRHTGAAFRAVMAATHPGSHERTLAALFEAVLAARGCTPGYGTILSQRGEILHNRDHGSILEQGRLLLLDGGGELTTGHGADVTRTWPVGGQYSPRQLAAYQAVLEAEREAIARCLPGVRYREVHDTASLIIARFLVDEGLVTTSPEAAVETGAHALFFPHGVGHLLGMDVHDLENFGDRPAYPPDRRRSDQFGTAYLRLDLPLEPGWVVTVEPGFYVVPAILGAPRFRERFAGTVDFDRAAEWVGFGGIRIEDDVHVTRAGPDILTAGIPSEPAEVEALVGSGPVPEVTLHSG